MRTKLEDEARAIKIDPDSQPSLSLRQTIKEAHKNDPTWIERFDNGCRKDATAAFVRELREAFQAKIINTDQLINLIHDLPRDVRLTADRALVGSDRIGQDIIKSIATYEEIEEARHGRSKVTPSSKEPPSMRGKTDTSTDSALDQVPR